jgi:hypothetical protein
VTRIAAALFRKEWHEHKREAVVLTTVLCIFTLATTVSSSRDIVADFQLASGLFSVFVAMFVGVAAVTRERTEGVLDFVCSLPVPLWWTALVRFLITVATCAVPIATTAVITHVVIACGIVSGNVSDLWVAAFVAIGCATSLTLWISAIAIDQPNQTRAGLVALFVLVSWFGITLLLTNVQRRPDWPPWLIRSILYVGPGGWWEISTVPIKRPSSGLLVAQIVANAVLLSLAVMNYGGHRKPAQPGGRVRASGRSARLVRLRSPALALCWLQIRELAPIAFAGLLLSAIWWVCQILLFRTDPLSPTVLTRNMTVATVGIGLLWMGIVAVAIFVPNLQPKLETFWRSRPLNVSFWFWSKALFGLVASVVRLNLPTLLMFAGSDAKAAVAPASELAGQLCVVMAHTMVYSVAILVVCFVRQSAYAGIVSLSASAMILLVPVAAGQPEWNASLSFAELGQLLRVDVAGHRLVLFAESGFVVTGVNDLAFIPFLAMVSGISVGSMIGAWLVVRRNIVISQ